MTTINCKGKLLDLRDPVVMGIINTTPDSFYQGFLGLDSDEMVTLAGKMIEEGAAILDIGGTSTRPGSKAVSELEEMNRVVPVISLLHAAFPSIIISVDTYNSNVAGAAVDAGAVMVNDISGGRMDKNMIAKVASLQVPYICMHMQGTPETMQQDPVYTDPVSELLDFFIERIENCSRAGIKDIIIDPGFGFGKTIEHNFQLLKGLQSLRITGRPVLVGLSRKSTIYKTLGQSAAQALNGTTVLNTLALANGASILRVHDVKEAREAITLFTAYKNAP